MARSHGIDAKQGRREKMTTGISVRRFRGSLTIDSKSDYAQSMLTFFPDNKVITITRIKMHYV